VSVTATGRRPATARDLRPSSPGGCRDAQLLRRFACSRDPVLREQLVRRYLPLARYAASQYVRGSEPFDDLLQVASLGLLKAIDRYDPERGAAFSSYALPTMAGELRRHFRDRGWAVRPPRDLQERALLVERGAETLALQLGRSPTVTELAEHTGLDAETMLEAREALSARSAASLSAPSHHGDDDDPGLEGRLGAEDDGYEVVEQRAALSALTRALTPRERQIVRLRFEEDLTQAEIGQVVGLSQMHVSRVLRGAVEKLRAAAAKT